MLVLEGYDLIVYGSVVPALLAQADWSLSLEQVGFLGSVAIVGMMAGALLAGALTDRIGRKQVAVLSVCTFSVAMLMCSVAPTVTVFAVARFVVGLGAGCLMPTTVALILEYSPSHRRNINSALAFAGVGTGGALSGLIALAFVPEGEFRPMFLVGGSPALLLVPALVRWMPESAAHLLASGRPADARAVLEHHGVRGRFVQDLFDTQESEPRDGADNVRDRKQITSLMRLLVQRSPRSRA